MRIKLITGSAGHVQGWGDLATTEMVADILGTLGHEAEISFITEFVQLHRELRRSPCDLAWSSLYYLSEHDDFVGDSADQPWILELLERLAIPYVGSGYRCMRAMLDKAHTNERLRRAGIGVPWQHCIAPGQEIPALALPAFVKPRFESESTGVNEQSVVTTFVQLEERIEMVHRHFQQSAVVEEYLPGREFTVSMTGNGPERRFRPVENIIHSEAFERYPTLTNRLKEEGWLKFEIPEDRSETLCTIAEQTATVLDCLDHVRIDLREDATGQPKVIDVNGIPGLNPLKSRSLIIESLYGVTAAEAPAKLISAIIEAAAARYNLTSHPSPKGSELSEISNATVALSATK